MSDSSIILGDQIDDLSYRWFAPGERGGDYTVAVPVVDEHGVEHEFEGTVSELLETAGRLGFMARQAQVEIDRHRAANTTYLLEPGPISRPVADDFGVTL